MLKVECLTIKDLEIMKTLRYLLMICTLTIAAVAFGQAKFKTAEDKEAFDYQVGKSYFDFYTTSTMMESGSKLPIAARNGLTINSAVDEDLLAEAQAIRRSRKGGIGPTTPDDDPTPVGEGMWVLLMMAAGYAGWMMLRRRRILQAERMA